MITIDRAFSRIDEGLVHYRHAGPADGPVLLMLHASPGSSRGLERLMEAIGAAAPVLRMLAPDTLGNGDSVEPSEAAPDIAWYADRVAEFMDAAGVAGAVVYGTHIGARIAAELAIRHPAKVHRVIFDGIGDYEPDMRALLLDRYAPEIEPDEYGRHLIWAFNFIRDQATHYPYFLRDPEHRLMTRAVPGAAEIHERVVELLKSVTSYHKSYRAAFAYRATERLPLVERPCAFLDSVAELPTLRARLTGFVESMPDARTMEVEPAPEGKAAAIARLCGAAG